MYYQKWWKITSDIDNFISKSKITIYRYPNDVTRITFVVRYTDKLSNMRNNKVS